MMVYVTFLAKLLKIKKIKLSLQAVDQTLTDQKNEFLIKYKWQSLTVEEMNNIESSISNKKMNLDFKTFSQRKFQIQRGSLKKLY